jgi:hypothetical protein
MKVNDLRRPIVFTLSAIVLTAVVLWVIILPADIAAVLVVFVAAVIIQCIVVIAGHLSQSITADEMWIERQPDTHQLTDGRNRA